MFCFKKFDKYVVKTNFLTKLNIYKWFNTLKKILFLFLVFVTYNDFFSIYNSDVEMFFFLPFMRTIQVKCDSFLNKLKCIYMTWYDTKITFFVTSGLHYEWVNSFSFFSYHKRQFFFSLVINDHIKDYMETIYVYDDLEENGINVFYVPDLQNTNLFYFKSESVVTDDFIFIIGSEYIKYNYKGNNVNLLVLYYFDFYSDCLWVLELFNNNKNIKIPLKIHLTFDTSIYSLQYSTDLQNDFSNRWKPSFFIKLKILNSVFSLRNNTRFNNRIKKMSIKNQSKRYYGKFNKLTFFLFLF